MRLYLSSFRLGDHPDELLRLLGGGRRIAVIGNAIDALASNLPVDAREQGVTAEISALEELGLVADEIDLRRYFGDHQGLAEAIAAFDGVWVRGGNCFVLRAAMSLSGADRVFAEGLDADSFVYAGYSAGPAVLAPSLRGLELVDPIDDVQQTYGVAPIWDGMRVLDFAFVPHHSSPGHPESEDIDRVVARYDADGTPYRTLRDGQALIVDGGGIRLI